MGLKNVLHQIGHGTSYSVWLIGQIVKESTIMAYDTFTTGRHIAPVMIYYPLRLTRERDIAVFIASITMTPGTLALGVTGPKEVDEDAAAGKRNLDDASSVATSEFRTHGLTRVQRFLAVHAMYGADPQELLHSLAVMEAKISPSVRKRKIEFDVEHLVERGVPGPRGYRGNRGGRASEDGVFDIEKVDSTPHAAAFVAAIMRQDDNLDENDLDSLSREQREKIAKAHARKAAEEKRRRLEEEEQRRRRKLAEELSLRSSTLTTTATTMILRTPRRASIRHASPRHRTVASVRCPRASAAPPRPEAPGPAGAVVARHRSRPWSMPSKYGRGCRNPTWTSVVVGGSPAHRCRV
ncbi:Na+/H+ antiporter subunit E [Corynebacterium sp. CNJ-954]|uniref:Na+/H+ antiporter subunit E n=1 Tax=Corynebacterium sp. CNJ-954 TaxID=1904962 RepID=UPI0009F9E0A8|nr:Na+/H+ antiporter subunit E [Corynebacterium sp. CNJ-954]